MSCADVQTIQAGNGVKTQFSFDFPYISKSEIQVSFWNNITEQWDVKLTTDPTYPWQITDANPTIVEFTGTPPPSAVSIDNVRIRRITNISDIRALFNPGSAIRSDDLNNNFEQLRFAIQEANCQENVGVIIAGGTLAGALDMDEFKITNLGNPTNPQDAVTKSYVDTQDATKLNLSGGTMTGNITFNGGQTFPGVLPLAGGTMTGSIAFSVSQPTGTTSTPGIIQLTDSTSSTSTTTAATPNSVKSTYDAAMLKTGGTFTGDVTLNAQSDLRFADSDSSNWVAFQAPATVASNVTWTLPSADGTDGQKLSTNGSGVLSWTASVPNITYLTSGTSATYTPTTGTKAIYVEVVGAGGGGGGVDGQGASTAALAGAGGGGAYVAKMITNMSQTFTYSVGTGGNGGAAGTNNGSTGGTTTFVASVTGTLTASGGTGGTGVLAGSSTDSGGGGAGGATFTGGDLNLRGGANTVGTTTGATFNTISQAGCAPYFGTVGIAQRASNNNGPNGGNPGEGGAGGAVSATTANYAGGNGAAGIIRITEFF